MLPSVCSTLPLHATALACLSVSGKDAQTFLQGQLSCDLRPLAWQGDRGGCTPGYRLNLKGRVVASLYVLGVPEGFLLLLPATQVEALLADLKKYVLFSKAQLQATTHQVLAVAGTHEGLPAPAQVLAKEAAWLAQLSGVDACLVILPASEGIAVTASSAWAQAELAAGLAAIEPATAGLWLPQELGADATGAVSYNKGCYLGQEIVARLHFKGEAKQHLYRLTLTGATAQPEAGALLQDADGKPAGQLVQSAPNEQGLSCLAVLRAPVAGSVQLGGVSWQVADCAPTVAP